MSSTKNIHYDGSYSVINDEQDKGIQAYKDSDVYVGSELIVKMVWKSSPVCQASGTDLAKSENCKGSNAKNHVRKYEWIKGFQISKQNNQICHDIPGHLYYRYYADMQIL